MDAKFQAGDLVRINPNNPFYHRVLIRDCKKMVSLGNELGLVVGTIPYFNSSSLELYKTDYFVKWLAVSFSGCPGIISENQLEKLV